MASHCWRWPEAACSRFGFILWFPLIPFEFAAGQLNLLIAAAIVVAQRGVTWPLAIVSFAKVWPALRCVRLTGASSPSRSQSLRLSRCHGYRCGPHGSRR